MPTNIFADFRRNPSAIKHKLGFEEGFRLLCGVKIQPLSNNDLYFDAPWHQQKPFKPHYDQYILPEVRFFEMERLHTLHDIRSRRNLAIPAAIGIVMIMIQLSGIFGKNGDNDWGFFWFTMVMLAGVAAFCLAPVASYHSSIKNRIFPDIFRFFGEDFRFMERPPLSLAELHTFGILPSYENGHTEDYVKGSYKSVAIELMELQLTKTRKMGRHRHTVTVFNGLAIRLSMPKKFRNKTILFRDAGAVGNWIKSLSQSHMEPVTLEDKRFEKQYEIYSNDQIEARYILTPSFMERIKKLDAYRASFLKNELLLLLPSERGWFEAGPIDKPASFTHDIRTILNQMQSIFDIIDLLKLDERTGL
jgi:hypothetical protein